MMVNELIDRLNQLCRKAVTDEQNFTEGDEIRKVFKEIKDLGYRIYSEPYDKTSIVTDYLSDIGKSKYTKLLVIRQQKMDSIGKQEYERAADLRDVERHLEREVMLDYIKKEGIAYFEIHDQDAKEIICYFYCELLRQYFKIGVEPSVLQN